jgi:hypothetical protein
MGTRIPRVIVTCVVALITLSGCLSSTDRPQSSKSNATRIPNVDIRDIQPSTPNDTGYYYYVEETGHSISIFAEAFDNMGGVHGLGFPLTEPFIQKTADGQQRWVQYFEKAIIEHHPENASPNDFQITSLGADRFKQRYSDGVPAERVVPGEASHTFEETGHTVRGVFLKRWYDGGELRRFGYPLSGSFEEQSDVDGQTYIVQYFERTVMEYHPELKPPHDVQLAALGFMKLGQIPSDALLDQAKQPIPATTGKAKAAEVAMTKATATAQAVSERARATAETAYAYATATAEVALANSRATAMVVSSNATATAFAKSYSSPSRSGGSTGGGTLCADGTYSSSTGRGSCSHHGGAANKKRRK